MLGLGFGWALSVVVASGHYRSASYLALALLLAGVLAVTVLGLRFTVLTLREWKTLEAQTIGAVGTNMARWYATVCTIRQTYTAEQIAFARRYLADVAAQARGRLSLFIGALEKVSIISMTSTYPATRKSARVC